MSDIKLENYQDVINKVVEELKELYGDKLKKIVLYGSYAKGTQNEESDIDIAVLVDEDEQALKDYENKLDEIISEIGYRSLKLISIVDISYQRYMQYKEILPYYKNIENEGIVLYG
ncbi:nucleotidyltransferase domain-containing protein [Caldicellulosiruptor changbaiensis]|uniref:Nucleotidyltransferase domain-containing protein n=2 Tax=Caldicellulosiruptor TaxID=44000 RepID=A0A3T0D648_9FIRM|nr:MULTISPECIES: nucleotidyltransferase domain-containing protein [Caldicellulosiruptor]AZT90555.1 nucleotidyltransferase domain-containing protein [Caldicellulosiruptor changbaiensis]WAM30818.1 nucleotidyltransferase domain-containing protein [Caldicellulosiruptor naganoensis]